MTHRLLDGNGRVALWQDDPNVAAAGLYDRLGYAPGHSVSFGQLHA